LARPRPFIAQSVKIQAYEEPYQSRVIPSVGVRTPKNNSEDYLSKKDRELSKMKLLCQQEKERHLKSIKKQMDSDFKLQKAQFAAD